jgi:hypothetical protein
MPAKFTGSMWNAYIATSTQIEPTTPGRTMPGLVNSMNMA